LIALAAPAILQSRGAARRATCQNRQHELMVAVASFEQAKNRLPGWREQLGPQGKTKDVTWSFVLLPYLQRKDLYQQYSPGGVSAAIEPTEHVDLFLCPDDVEFAPTAPTSFAVNCGLPDAGDVTLHGRRDLPANGLFHDQMPVRGWQRLVVQMRTTDIVDGASATIALTDRTEVVRWTDWKSERRVGLWWQNTLDPPNEARVNGIRPPLAESHDVNHARPSAGHSGGVIVSYADGSNRFLSEQVDYLVYALLMTPHGAKAKLPDGGEVIPAIRQTPLPEGSLGE
jgi:hypothetical protein